jgi:pimeloyl-ACP methyl ester carboxylesterase
VQRADLIFLPGLLCDRAIWAPQIEALADLARITVGDLTTADSMAGMAESILSVAPERFALAGFSMGGYVSFEIMRRAPERVTRLALLDTSARPDTPEQTMGRLALMQRYGDGEFTRIASELLPRWVRPSRRDNRALIGAATAMIGRIGREGFRRQQRAIMDRLDSRPGLASITGPVLVLCGRDDQVTPVELHEEVAAGIPGAQLKILPACGHFSTLEQPEAVSAALRAWLTTS